MSGLTKCLSVRLDCEQYEQLHEEILRRDGWRCQLCGALSQLQVHHLQFRSQSGEDNEENLITLCRNCHEMLLWVDHRSCFMQKLMRHSDIRTTLNIYGDVVTDEMSQVNSKLAELALNGL